MIAIQKAVPHLPWARRTSPWTIGFSEAQRRGHPGRTINWRRGVFTHADAPPAEGLAAARIYGDDDVQAAHRRFSAEFGKKLLTDGAHPDFAAGSIPI